VRPWIFGEDNFTHTGAQTIRTNENIGVIRGPIAKRQPNPIRRSGDTGHAHIEPRIDACGSRLCEQNFDERAAADGDARSAEHALMVRLVGKRKPLAFGVQNFDAGGVDTIRLNGLEATNRSQSVCAVRSQG